MGKVFDRIDDKIRHWIDRQHMFFVATAPLSDTGRINLSPKGNDTLRILDDRTLAYMDSGGSGIETVAHLRENQRIVIMMCAFDGPPRIYRFHGTGDVITALDEEFEQVAAHFDRSQLGIRAIVRVNLTRISDSCGFGVPLYEYQAQRTAAVDHLNHRGVEQVRAYLTDNNATSIDGISGISAREAEAFQAPEPRE